MRTFKNILATGIALPLMLTLACSGHPVLDTPPQPDDFDSLEPALAEWIERGVQRVERNPGDFAAFFSLCQIYDANELYETALKCYEMAAAAEPDRAKTWYFLAQVRWRNGDRAAAVQNMERSIEGFPHYSPSHARLGRWLLEIGELDAAQRSFERVRDIDPSEAVGRVSLAQVMLEREDVAAATELLHEILRDDPRQPAALMLLETAKNLGGESPESLSDLELPLAEGRMMGNDPWAAELDLFVVGYSARLTVAEEYLASGKPEAAAEVLEAFRVDEPANVAAMNALARVYLRLERLDEAKAMFEEAIAIDAGNYQAHLELASIFMLSNDAANALGHIDRAIESRPDLGLAHLRRGAILRGMSRYADAIQSFNKAEQISPGEKMIPRATGDCYTRLQAWSDAAASYERALAIDQTDPDLYSRAGFAYVKLGRLDDAEGAFANALAHDSPQSEAVQKMLDQVRERKANPPG